MIANNSTVVEDFDIFAQAGKDQVTVKEFNVSVAGSLVLRFLGQLDNAQVNAIEIVPI